MSGSGEPSLSANPDLESFREQWRAEVRARVPGAAGGPSNQQPHRQNHHRHRAASSASSVAAAVGHPGTQPPPPVYKPPVLKDYEDDYVQPRSFGEADGGGVAGEGEGGSKGVQVVKEPVSALEHYEKAVERESAGSLGDSLRLYRKAFRVSGVS